MKVITDISMEEQYTPKGTKQVMKVEDIELTLIRPWDLYAAATLSRPYMSVEEAINRADKLLIARRERYPHDE